MEFYEGVDGDYYIRKDGYMARIPRDMIEQFRNGLEQAVEGGCPKVTWKDGQLGVASNIWGQLTDIYVNNIGFNKNEGYALLEDIDDLASNMAVRKQLVRRGLKDMKD